MMSPPTARGVAGLAALAVLLLAFGVQVPGVRPGGVDGLPAVAAFTAAAALLVLVGAALDRRWIAWLGASLAGVLSVSTAWAAGYAVPWNLLLLGVVVVWQAHLPRPSATAGRRGERESKAGS